MYLAYFFNFTMIRLLIVLFLMAIIMGVGIITLSCRKSTDFYGTVLEPPIPAPHFELQSHLGNIFTLTEQKGNVVVLTFLYTSCVDVCPFIAQKLKLSHEILENDSLAVTIVVITTDPARDTVQRVRHYSSVQGMTNKWHFLVGNKDEVEPVWEGYFAAVLPRQDASSHIREVPTHISEAVSDQAKEIAEKAINSFGGDYVVDHSTPIFIIDQEGQARVLMSAGFSPSELSHNIRLLLKQ